MLAGKGIRAVAVMWAMTFLSFILVPLRLYTRVYIIEALGVDDHVFNLAWVSHSSFEVNMPLKRSPRSRCFCSYTLSLSQSQACTDSDSP
jgi:hypothetical protein